ncbi:MAG: hypothetical protein ABR951_09255 [Candidatus Aminicenantales bacterium]
MKKNSKAFGRESTGREAWRRNHCVRKFQVDSCREMVYKGKNGVLIRKGQGNLEA